tara:strand:+ start:57 stop:542 length:486 start_codon:yes stop_codon:yes gene_type:complete
MNVTNLRKNYDDTLSDLTLLWARRNIELEIDILDGTRPTETEEERQIKEWVLQTPSKRKFGLRIIRATMDNSKVTIPELVKQSVASRISILEFVKECEDAGWITVCRDGKLNEISATPLFIKAYLNYCTWLAETYYTQELREILVSMRLLAHLKIDDVSVN